MIQSFAERSETPVVERAIDRTELYMAEELFFCGSAYEVHPVVEVDSITVAYGAVGPQTAAMWTHYEGLIRGTLPDHAKWPLFTPPLTGLGHADAGHGRAIGRADDCRYQKRRRAGPHPGDRLAQSMSKARQGLGENHRLRNGADPRRQYQAPNPASRKVFYSNIEFRVGL